ncbi:MAG: S-layer homology domain-containing protein [Oscillospiraceae bacterium]|nr:S-layer homology domain-containing protein [Oscillospiraceae bacterium]
MDSKASFDLDNNYWDGKSVSKAVDSGLKPPTEVGVSGGTFPIDVSEYANENFVAVEDENGNFVVEGMTEDNAVATVNAVPYNDFHKAILAAKSEDTVELLRDVTVESWQQVWNLSGVAVNGNNHTLKVNAIESLQNHDTVFHSAGNNRFYDLTIDLSGIRTQSHAQGYKAICAAPGDSFERVKVISGEQVPVYGIFVGGTDAEDEVIYIRNCSFKNCSYAIGAEPTSGIASDLETLEVTGCTFTNCDYVGILYAENVTFDNNSVTSGKLNIMHGSQKVTNNIFDGTSRIKFYADPAKFEKNDISAESCLEVVDAVESVDIAMNYWGGGAPSESQLGNAAGKVEGADEYYTSPNMDETNLCTITIIFDNGQMPAEIEGYEVGETFYFQPAPSKAGCIFMGWSWNGRTYQPGDSITITGDMVIRAIWSALPDIEPGQPSQPDEPDVPDFPFTDVSANAWYYEAVKYVYANGIMNGMDRYSFQPNGTLTRAMIWTMLARLDGVDTEGGANWYAKAQEWATATGVSDGENPTGEVTREQLITMLWRYAGSPTYTADLSSYVDTADISSWAEQAMCWAVATGVIEGDENSALTPKADTTRAQAAAMLMRAIEL